MARNKCSDPNTLQDYERTHVHTNARTLLVESQRILAHMNRAYKFSTGNNFVTAVTNTVTNISMAYLETDRQQKLMFITAALRSSTECLALLRTLNELRMLTSESYRSCVPLVVSIQQQLRSWKQKQIKYIVEQENSGITISGGVTEKLPPVENARSGTQISV